MLHRLNEPVVSRLPYCLTFRIKKDDTYDPTAVLSEFTKALASGLLHIIDVFLNIAHLSTLQPVVFVFLRSVLAVPL
jgi:hypothetical protein